MEEGGWRTKDREGGGEGGKERGRRHGEPSEKELRGGVEVEEKVIRGDEKFKHESGNDA